MAFCALTSLPRELLDLLPVSRYWRLNFAPMTKTQSSHLGSVLVGKETPVQALRLCYTAASLTLYL